MAFPLHTHKNFILHLSYEKIARLCIQFMKIFRFSCFLHTKKFRKHSLYGVVFTFALCVCLINFEEERVVGACKLLFEFRMYVMKKHANVKTHLLHCIELRDRYVRRMKKKNYALLDRLNSIENNFYKKLNFFTRSTWIHLNIFLAKRHDFSFEVLGRHLSIDCVDSFWKENYF